MDNRQLRRANLRQPLPKTADKGYHPSQFIIHHSSFTIPGGSMSVPGDIHSYQIEQELRVAGWGRSYLATDPTAKAGKVVLKFITHPATRQADWHARFQERIASVHALAQATDLPVVPIYHWGALEKPFQAPNDLIPAQTPYLILGYVKGSSLGEVLNGRSPLPLPYAATILNQIAAALDVVHAAGAVHANLKPDNILFSADGALYFTDFHLLLPYGGYLLNLSPKMSLEEAQYISPEQAQTDQTIGPCSDIYNLGLIFYEMVTGKRPFSGHSPAHLIRQHAFDPPPPARRYNPDLPADLDRVLQKALDKNHLARYQTAGEMAAAVWQLLPEEPTAPAPDPKGFSYPAPLPPTDLPPSPKPAAALPLDELFDEPPPPTRPARTGRPTPKPLLIIFILVTLLALCVCVVVGLGVLFFSSSAAPVEATQGEPTTAVSPTTQANSIFELLARSPSEQPAEIGPRSLTQLAQFGEGTVHAIVPSPIGGPIAIAGPLGVKLYHDRTLAPLDPVSDEPANAVAWVENGRLLATASNNNSSVIIRDKGGQLRQQIQPNSSSSVSRIVADNAGGQLAILLVNGELYIWVVANEALRGSWQFPESIRHIAWSPSGDQLALATDNQTVRLVSSTTGETTATLEGSPFNLTHAAWSPDGAYLAAFTASGYLLVWAVADGSLLLQERAGVSALSWAADGRSLITGHQDGSLRFWETKTWGASQADWPVQETAVSTLHWLDDPARLLSFSEDGWLRLHDGRSGSLLAERANFNSANFNAVSDLAWSPDGRYLAASSWDKTIRIWSMQDAAVSQVLRGHRSYIGALDWSPDGAWLASGSLDGGGALRLWSLDSGAAQIMQYEDDSPVSQLAFSPDGRWLAAGLNSGLLVIQPIPPGAADAPVLSGRPREEAISDLAWSPDNGRLLVANQKGYLTLWQLPAGQLEWEWAAAADYFGTRLDWSAAAPLVALGGDMAEIQLWGSEDWQMEQSLAGLLGVSLNEVAFAENGRWLAIVGGLREVAVFDLESGQIAYEGIGHGAAVRSVAWSPTNPNHLATGGDDGTIRLWLLPEGMGR
jgi:WD40 repeat protein/serine/threonine protein kinase